MKKQTLKKKLGLSTETIRVLSAADLAEAGGGLIAAFHRASLGATLTAACHIGVSLSSPLTAPCAGTGGGGTSLSATLTAPCGGGGGGTSVSATLTAPCRSTV
jgi:hypothetical protein